MGKQKAGTKILFKATSNEELQFFLELVQKILKNRDSIVETKMNSVNIRLYGKKEEVEYLANKLKDAFGLVKSAFRTDRTGRRNIDMLLLALLTGYQVDPWFFSNLLIHLNFGEKGEGSKIITTLDLNNLISRYRQAHLTFVSTLPSENRDIRKVIAILKILFPSAQVDEIVNFGLEKELFGYKEGKLVFRASKDQVFTRFKGDFVPNSMNERPTIESEKKSQKIIGGGKIVFRTKFPD